MLPVLVILGVAAILWWGAYARSGSLWLGCAAFVAVGYVLGPPFWTLDVGPVPLTVDRVLMVGLCAALAWQWRQGKTSVGVVTAADWLVVALVGYLTVRCALTPAPPPISDVKPWWRLVASFWMPAALYAVARVAPPGERAWKAMMGALAALGVFLAFTAFAEIAHQWWAVFPRYIADPTLGTHFGRARGPALNAASMGVYLTVCFWAVWMLVPRLPRFWQLFAAGVLALVTAAVFFTYTRSTWIGLGASLAVVPLFQFARPWRIAYGVLVVLAGGFIVVAMGDRVTNLERKDNDDSAEHSVYQRASFVYVSMRMFEDAPVFGCGFGRFYDLKLPYLSDRSQQLELDSLRYLDHHNTFLSVLVETGVIGFTLFVGMLAAWTMAAWRLARHGAAPWQRMQGLFTLATIITYVSSAAFHDLTLLPTEQWLLFLAASVTMRLVAEEPARLAAPAKLGPLLTATASRPALAN